MQKKIINVSHRNPLVGILNSSHGWPCSPLETFIKFNNSLKLYIKLPQAIVKKGDYSPYFILS
jgi:hypothetical protein